MTEVRFNVPCSLFPVFAQIPEIAGCTPLHWAAHNGLYRDVEILLTSGSLAEDDPSWQGNPWRFDGACYPDANYWVSKVALMVELHIVAHHLVERGCQVLMMLNDVDGSSGFLFL